MRTDLLQTNHKNKLINSPLLAIILNVLVLVLYITIFGVKYEIHDDLAVAALIQHQYFYIGFINYILCVIAYGFQFLVPFANGWVLLQIFLSFISFCTLSYIFSKSGSRIINFLFAALVPVVFAYDHYCDIQFTKTSALLLVTGIVTVLYYLSNHKQCQRKLLFIGCMLLLFGSWYRYTNIYPVFGLAAVWALFYITQKNKSGLIIFLKNNYRSLFVVLAVLIIVLGSHQFSIEINKSTPDLRYYQDFHAAQVSVIDYGGIPTDEKSQSYYNGLGFSKSDLSFLSDISYFDSEDLVSIEELRAIASNITSEAPPKDVIFSDMVNTLSQSINDYPLRCVHLIFLLSLLALSLVFTPNRWRVFSIVFFICVIGGYFYLFTLGRPLYRATYGIDLAGISFLMLSLSINSIKPSFAVVQKYVVVALSVVISVMAFIGIQQQANNLLKPDKETNANTLYNYMETHKDDFYIFYGLNDRILFYSTWNYYQNPIIPLPKDIFDNGYELSKWQPPSPFTKQKLQAFGLQNIYSDVIDKSNIYIVDNFNTDIAEQYFNDHYAKDGQAITFKLVDTIGGFNIWQVKSNE